MGRANYIKAVRQKQVAARQAQNKALGGMSFRQDTANISQALKSGGLKMVEPKRTFTGNGVGRRRRFR